jgi:hypothetical protein
VDAKVSDMKQSWPVLKYYPIIGTVGLKKKEGSQDCMLKIRNRAQNTHKCEATLLI